jgi:hypothetical protein
MGVRERKNNKFQKFQFGGKMKYYFSSFMRPVNSSLLYSFAWRFTG